MNARTLFVPANFFLLLLLLSSFSSPADLDIIRQRIVQELMEPKVKDGEIASLLTEIQEDGTWPGINYEDTSNTGFEHRFHTDNLVKLARAYQSPASSFHKKAKVKNALEQALRHWVNEDYICENWWFNQIGVPDDLVETLLLVGEELPKELVQKTQPIIGRANVDAPGGRPGGDRIKIAGIQAKNLLFLKDSQTFEEVIRIIENEIKFADWIGTTYGYGFRDIHGGLGVSSSNGRGIQYDYSFHHRTDGVNNTLSYGLGYARAFVEWAHYTKGTRYAFSEEKLAQLIDYYLDGICKTAVYGKYPDPGARNRSISRPGSLKAYGAETPEKLRAASDYRKEELQEIIDNRQKGIKPTRAHATYYWHSEHFSFQRPEWFASVRMYSTRLHNMEWPYNGEGLLNHHRGDGVNHLSQTGEEYIDIWPVYNYQKIPGATITQKPQLPPKNEIQKLGLTDFVGAVTDGTYGAVAFDFRSPHDPLIARKAWFFFDQEYVCLGSGIACKEKLPVLTTLNQTLLRDEVSLSSQGKSTVLREGERTHQEVDWVYHDGVGYVFPQPTTVHLKNEEVKGAWWRINKQTDSSKEEIKKEVFALWLDHGKRPSEATYEYLVVPHTTTDALSRKQSLNNITILANTPEMQAVKHESLQQYQLVFYQADTLKLTEELTLGSAQPGIVLLKMQGAKIKEISVADPSRTSSKMLLTLSAKIMGKGKGYRAFWEENRDSSHLIIDLPSGNYAGRSATISW